MWELSISAKFIYNRSLKIVIYCFFVNWIIESGRSSSTQPLRFNAGTEDTLAYLFEEEKRRNFMKILVVPDKIYGYVYSTYLHTGRKNNFTLFCYLVHIPNYINMDQSIFRRLTLNKFCYKNVIRLFCR